MEDQDKISELEIFIKLFDLFNKGEFGNQIGERD